MQTVRRFIPFLLLPVLLVGCDKSPDSRTALEQVPVEPSAILATVNGSPIRRDELELAVERTLGENAPLYINEEIERKILESLVSSRAIALKSEAELSGYERHELDLKTQAYREELLVKHYLQQQITPQPVSQEMVADYYAKNPGEFGGGSEKTFEVITVERSALDDKARQRAISRLSEKPMAENDWADQVAKLREEGIPAQHQKSRMKVSLIAQPLRSLVEPTAVGQVAPLHVGDKITLVRVIDEQALPPRPLSEVAGDIRKKLAPQRVKQAVSKLSSTVLGGTEVKYLTPDDE